MKSEIIKTAEIYRFPRLKNHIEEFIAHDLPWVLEDLRDYGLISGFCYTCKLTYDFRKGVDFYIFLGDKEIPAQLTDNIEAIPIFSNQGIITIFLPEKNKKGEVLFPQERRIIVIKKLEKAIKRAAYLV